MKSPISVLFISLAGLVTGPAIAQIPSGSAATRCGAPLYATVRSGVSLADIAREAGHGLRDIARWNGIAAANEIVVGQTLRVQPPECGTGGSSPNVGNSAAPLQLAVNTLCNELSQMIAFAVNDFADVKGPPVPGTKPVEYLPRHPFQSFDNCKIEDPRSPELDSPQISCRVKGMDDRGGHIDKFAMDEELHARLWSRATAGAEGISACLPIQPRTAEIVVKDGDRRIYRRWIVDAKGRDKVAVPIALTLSGRVSLAGRSIESYQSPGIGFFTVERDKGEVVVRQAEASLERVKRQRAALPANPSRDPKWGGAGWYRVIEIMGDPEISAGPFASKSACAKTLPTDSDRDEFVVFLCNRYDATSNW
jgi:LysM repeat protein